MDIDIQEGELLIATVSLLDPNFQQTVILVCRHEEENGSYGLVLNRPLATPSTLVEEMPYVDGRLYHGGPVQPERLQVLHPFGEMADGALEVLPGLWLGGNFDKLQAAFRVGAFTSEQCRFFLGYAGWARGQLAKEFAANAWIRVQGSAQLVLGETAEHLYAHAVRACGHDRPLYSHFPEDPNLN